MNFFKSAKEKEAFGDDSDSESQVHLDSSDFKRSDVLLCGTHGNVYAIRKEDGHRLWRAKIRNSAVASVIALFVTDTDKVLAAGGGRTVCLDLYTGTALWVNKMSGFGLEEVSILSTPSRILAPKPITADHADNLPAYEEKQNIGRSVAIACARGKCMAMNLETGEELWRYNCPGGGYSIPVALIETGDSGDKAVYVGCGRYVYCLDIATGEVKWSSKICNTKLGYGYMTLATPWNSRLAAEAHTGFSNQPTAQAADLARQRAASS
ncbi:uncharacterized protein BYT42DRAFT_215850 [Radiomyces spectabilis]|uniref:uncharacterized protein n=1 Tax=Radiomyces spectabilis TaxID=64574 RepID=UPI00221F5ABC|nr:uncharacterized protein BYT42DRAFT_215850 [Radiomyces spectabilis]KAI8387966.1 hypothetical protein BYT42DRAFT_215850 [Radiomyces spectabilis]